MAGRRLRRLAKTVCSDVLASILLFYFLAAFMRVLINYDDDYCRLRRQSLDLLYFVTEDNRFPGEIPPEVLPWVG